MNYSFFDFLTLVGSIGLFLYGMKIMSEGLQKIAGDKLRSILAVMTRNRFAGVLTGIIITAIIQSSSATTVMVVSFVNAGLLSLQQSISVIMGANIGTTVTAWIVTLLGFKVSIADLAIPLMAVAIPLVFSSVGKRKTMGEVIMGFSFLFLGLDYMKNSVPDLGANPDLLAFLSNYTDLGFISVLIFLMVGTLLTIVVQSSSATMAITLVMCAKGWIPFELAVAMVMGENIGTTVTANIAAIQANVSAKRAALAHLAFNVFGVIWMLVLFYPFLAFVSYIATKLGSSDPSQLTEFLRTVDPATFSIISNADANTILTPAQEIIKEQWQSYVMASLFGLSIFHTAFNVINTCTIIWFVNTLAKVVSLVIKQKESDEEFQLKYIATGMLSTAELSLIQARKEVTVYSERSLRMYGLVKEMYMEEGTANSLKLFNRIEKYEGISDRMEVEIATYLTKVAEGRLSDTGKMQLQQMLRIVSEIESIGDGCYNLARIIMRKKEEKFDYTPEMRENLTFMSNLLLKSFNKMNRLLEEERSVSDEAYGEMKSLEIEINNLRDHLKLQNVIDVEKKKYGYQMSITYMDMISEFEKIADYILNVVEALRDNRTL